MKITAAVTRAKSEPFCIRELDLEGPHAGEILVKVLATGMCHTDLIVRDQYYPVPLPAVLGHEGAGVVEAVGAGVNKVKVGDHVVMSFGACDTCSRCLQGEPGYCRDFFGANLGGIRSDGSAMYSDQGEPVHGNFFQQSSFGSHAICGEQNIVKVPKDLPLEILGPLGCGIQTGAGAVMNAFKPDAGTSIVVFGAGSVGLSAIMAAKVVGCTTIIAVDVQASRLRVAAELGATAVVNPVDIENVSEWLIESTGGGADFSLETTSLPEVLRQAVDCIHVRGTCGVVGAPAIGTEVVLDVNNILFGRTIRGIIEGDSMPDIFIPRLIELYKQGRFPFDKLLTFYDLDDINQAASDSSSGAVIKPVIRMPL
jgi:aryl-alcohol dehydrogenase